MGQNEKVFSNNLKPITLNCQGLIWGQFAAKISIVTAHTFTLLDRSHAVEFSLQINQMTTAPDSQNNGKNSPNFF